MKTTLSTGLSVLAFMAIMPMSAQTTGTTQKKSTAKVGVVESAEHAFARANCDSLKQQSVDSRKVFFERMEQDTDCKAFYPTFTHPISTADTDHYMVGCREATKTARYVMEKVTEAMVDYEFRLEHVDECLKTYRRTIDKKLSDQTTRGVETIRVCQSARLYPPPTK